MLCFVATKTVCCPDAVVGMYYDHYRIRIRMSRAERTGSCVRSAFFAIRFPFHLLF